MIAAFPAPLLTPAPARRALTRILFALTLLAGFLSGHAQAQSTLSNADLERIGRRIWQNECAGTVEGLTSWNTGESFASLGIGHFIWYPAGQEGPFDESFPKLVAYFQQTGVQVPRWLLETRDCPWPNRQAFLKDKNSPRQKELRTLLSNTIPHQTQFIILRLNEATPRMEAAAGPRAQQVRTNIQLLRQTPAGNFAMIDYVNFKGEGLKPEERYNGQGWGLLQVLMAMQPRDAASAPAAFAEASKQVLTQRVKNAPPARKEDRWLQGWLNRCDSYRR